MKEPLKLRAHHGMCLAFFEGKGYSSAFTENMEKFYFSVVSVLVAGYNRVNNCPQRRARSAI